MKLRKWQKKGQEKLLELLLNGSTQALFAACPGAGKTHFTGSVFASPQINCRAELFIVVVPSRALKRQWKKALQKWNMSARDDIDNQTLDSARKRGVAMFDPADPVHVYTYAQVSNDFELFATLCARYRVYVVFDEIHHADDAKPYGENLISAFSDAVFKLSLTGTPFNTSAGTLAFCETVEKIDDEGKRYRETVVDFAYSYGDALAATGDEDDPPVVRPVTFLGSNGKAWRTYYDSKLEKTFTKEFTGTRRTDPLTPMLDIEEDYVREMIKSGLAKLDEIRRESHKNAGMLITAIDGDHARAISEYLRHDLGITDLEVILFDTPGAHDSIERFEKSSDRILIAVKMISEGVDIKRLRVGVYASNTMTFLFFLQFVGRFIRWDHSLGEEQRAYVVIPHHITIEGYAEKVEEMIAHAYMPEEDGGAGGGGDVRNHIVDKGTEWAPGDAIERGQRIVYDERAELDSLMDELQIPHLSYDEARRIRDRIGGYSARPSDGGDGGFDKREKCSRDNDKLVKKCAVIAAQKGMTWLDFAKVQNLANQSAGIDKKDKLTPLDALERRHDYLRTLLASIYSGKLGVDDAA